ncbi:MSC_0882 family membrane protein [Mycoplasma tauri]|uniref:Uncharacterized protein n=1 Tax=Mycoplasma tauri TaxID=547987 RepID=A0A953T9R1_9MOLU|nr:hypothetical protein [Mycoplasma tauri]MBZ4195524.1 hypothetical protein [Mycoplasma tauri]MBZ4203734.1 hypothetical protein [Mycoplasma tauri]MBZ4204309.1 hypothetical protein [Mycoplasma tauri]MBZ4218379.1 hypothetical protein [Mycoplasma tauri]QSB07574.1 hypothetical protein JS510_00380 [Mycoplasma tauri]
MKFRPIQNNQTIEIVQSNRELDFGKDKEKIHQDPKRQFSPRIYKVIRSEKILKISLMMISFIIMISSIVAFFLVYFKVPPFNTSGKPLTGYLILFGILIFFSFVSGLKNSIENLRWTHTIQRYRDAISTGDYTSSATFHIVYKKIILKDINLLWMLIFIITYQGLFTLIIFGFYKSGAWVAGSKNGAFYINLDWPTWLDLSFKNTEFFCLISLIIMVSLVVSYIFIKIFDSKRLNDISDFLGERSVEVQDQIDKAKKDRNKMWLRIYLVVVVLTIFLPLALLLVAMWRGIIRRKKKVIAAA